MELYVNMKSVFISLMILLFVQIIIVDMNRVLSGVNVIVDVNVVLAGVNMLWM